VPGEHRTGKWRIEWGLGGRVDGRRYGFFGLSEGDEDFVDLIDPLGVLGFHQDGAEGGDGGLVASDGRGEILEEGGGEFGKGEVEIFGGGGFEDSAGLGGDFGEGGCWRLWIGHEDHDVEFGFEGGDEFVSSEESSEEREGGVSSLLELLGEFAVPFERQ